MQQDHHGRVHRSNICREGKSHRWKCEEKLSPKNCQLCYFCPQAANAEIVCLLPHRSPTLSFKALCKWCMWSEELNCTGSRYVNATLASLTLAWLSIFHMLQRSNFTYILNNCPNYRTFETEISSSHESLQRSPTLT